MEKLSNVHNIIENELNDLVNFVDREVIKESLETILKCIKDVK